MQSLFDPERFLLAEGDWRWVVTLAIFCGVATWETLRPFRGMSVSTARRWTGNLTLYFTTSWLAALILPFSAVAVALGVQGSPYGLLNRSWLPAWAAWLLTILALDFIRFSQHWLLHRVPILWRVHRVHHSDPDYDLTTGLRFHPLEAMLTISTQCAAVALIAPPPMAVLAGELLFIAQVHLVHGNVAFPEGLDRKVRLLFVTPNVHSVHHTTDAADQNTNFGGVFSFWDRLCRTFQVRSPAERAEAPMGLEGFEGERGARFSTLFLLPFQRDSATQTDPEPRASASGPKPV